uniref:Methyltransferase domain-containing protein n=1 Tax=Alexandrium catenella TaxID=2925 RepID=A0A7S1RMN5_ALECA|mmetsp:Transcript_65311/g.174075  ORF Transcript_65311/g.174075 Transcript_65311/m.174075 type:complete len:204 (+) Transcript_65311:60-671(+)
MEKWSAFYRDGFLPWRSGEPYPQLVDLLASGRLEPGSRCLEFGCGTGENCMLLARSGFDVTGVDLVPRAVELASEAAAGLERARFLRLDVFDLPTEACPAGAYDLLVDCQVFHVLRLVDEARVVRAMEQMLRPGGLALVVTGHSADPGRGPEPLARDDFGVFEAAGLVIESLEESRFAWTEHYRSQGRDQPPQAWAALLRKPA